MGGVSGGAMGIFDKIFSVCEFYSFKPFFAVALAMVDFLLASIKRLVASCLARSILFFFDSSFFYCAFCLICSFFISRFELSVMVLA